MKILNYSFSEPNQIGWIFPQIEFNRINLIVGNSGVGKSRFIYSIFNLGRYIVGSADILSGIWKIKIEIQNIIYEYELEVNTNNFNKPTIDKEILRKTEQATSTTIIERSYDSFVFNSEHLPKLSNNVTGIFLLKDEDLIKPIYEGFKLLLKRDFGENSIKENATILLTLNNSYEQIKTIDELFRAQLNLNLKFDILKKRFPEIFKLIIREFINVFPFVKNVDVKNLTDFDTGITQSVIPVLSIREQKNDKWIRIDQISTGMFKVLLILTDLYTLPAGSIYLIDEYENSLGVNAIHFLPDILNLLDNDIQIFITSHHPYLINKIPIQDWIIFNRKGLKIDARFGEENRKLYGNSKHDQYINLLNDPFYNMVN